MVKSFTCWAKVKRSRRQDLAGLDTGFKMNINDNTILITGGSSGIGFEMAKQFLKRNNKVIITGRNKQKLEKSKQQLDGVTAIQNDVSNPDDVEKLNQQQGL